MRFQVPEMSCGHCTSAIEKSVKAADSSAEVQTDLGTRTVEVTSTLSPEVISLAIKDAGYASVPLAG